MLGKEIRIYGLQPMVLTLSRTNWETVLGFNIYTNHVIETRGPDIVLVKKVTKECVMIVIFAPGNPPCESGEDRKIEDQEVLGPV